MAEVVVAQSVEAQDIQSTNTMSLREKLGVTVDKENKSIIKELDNGDKISIGLDQTHPIVNTGVQILQKGVPTNSDIEQSVNQWKEFINSRSTNLNSQGKKILGDANLLLDSVQTAIVNKNKNDVWKRLIEGADELRKEVQEISVKEAQELKQELSTDQVKKQAKADFKEFVENVQSVVLFLVRSQEFREMLLDVISLMQSMARRFDQEYADKIQLTLRTDLVQVNVDEREQTSIKSLSREIWNTGRGNILLEEDVNKMEHQLKTIIDTVSKKPQYSQIITKMMALLDKVEGTFKDKQQSIQQQYEQEKRERYQKILNDALLAVGEFTGHEELTQFKARVTEFFRMISSDEQVRQYIMDLKQFVLEAAQNPLVASAENTQEMNLRQDQIKTFVQRGRQAFAENREKYNEMFTQIKESALKMLEHMKQDDTRKDIQDKFVTLVRDMITDENGRPDLFIMQQSITQFKSLMGTLVNEQLVNLPLPTIAIMSDNYDLAIGNMTFDASGILPEHIHLNMVNDMNLNTNEDASTMETQLKFSMNSIRMNLKNVHFTFNHKKAPRIKDNGVMDVSIAGKKGLSLKIVWKMNVTNKPNRKVEFKLSKLKCKISKLKIKVKQAPHKNLHRIAIALFKRVIKRRVCQAIESKLSEAIENVNTKLNEVSVTAEQKLNGNNLSEKTRERLERVNSVVKQKFDELPESKDLTLENMKHKVKEQVNEKKNKVQTSVMKVIDQVRKTEEPPVVLVVEQTTNTIIVTEPVQQQQQVVQQEVDNQCIHPNVLPMTDAKSNC
jgi:hypothetical protein